MVQAVDYDNDPVDVPFCVVIEDGNDPFEDPGSFLGIVEEEHLDNFNATFPVSGTANIEGSNGIDDFTSFNPDGDDNPATPDGDDDTPDPVNFDVTTDVTSGTLTITGGDGALTFGFEVTDGTPVVFGENNAIQVLSKGDPVYFVRDPGNPNILYGVANDDGGPDDLQTDDRIVFKIELTPATGAFVFTLIDQIDHHPYDAFPVDNQEGIMTVDLAGVFNVDDADVDLTDKHVFQDVKVKVIDDVPVEIGRGTAVVELFEDALNSGIEATDQSVGILDNDGDGDVDGSDVAVGADEDTFTYAQIAGLFGVGADEELKIKLTNFAEDTGIPGSIKSKGAFVNFHSASATSLIGFADEAGGTAGVYDAGIDRVVFTLTDNLDGTFTFDLDDQIDHTPSVDVLSNDLLTLDIDLTPAFTSPISTTIR